MKGRTVLIPLGIAVFGLGVGLAIAVRSTSEAPVAASPARVEREGRATPAPRLGDSARPAEPMPPPPPPGGYKKFELSMGIEAKPFGTDPSKRYPIPTGGFNAWTGREGWWPGQMEAFAAEAKVNMAVAYEQRRTTLLEERTIDRKAMAEILGKEPTPEMNAAIEKQLRQMQDDSANIQVNAREGRLSDDAAVKQSRAIQDAYRRAYLEATGITEQQFDQFFSPDRPLL